MSEPSQKEIGLVAEAMRSAPVAFSQYEDDCSMARAAIAALDKARGETVPVDKLLAKINELWDGQVSFRAQKLVYWLVGKRWLDDKTPVVQTDRRKP
jgi:hypothetical protein